MLKYNKHGTDKTEIKILSRFISVHSDTGKYTQPSQNTTA